MHYRARLWYTASFIYFDAFRSYNLTLKAAYTIGDVLSRRTDTVTSDDLQGLNTLYAFLTRDEATNTYIRVTQYDNNSGNLEVDWSYATSTIGSLTNADLAAAVANGQLRADLYHRINVMTLEMDGR